jgi:hypothetical protein
LPRAGFHGQSLGAMSTFYTNLAGGPIALGSISGWHIVMPIRDVRVRARFGLGATLFVFFFRRVATRLGIFVVSAGLCLRQINSLSIVAFLSRGLKL